MLCHRGCWHVKRGGLHSARCSSGVQQHFTHFAELLNMKEKNIREAVTVLKPLALLFVLAMV